MKTNRTYSATTIAIIFAFLMTIMVPLSHGIAEAAAAWKWQCQYCGDKAMTNANSSPHPGKCLRGPNKGNLHSYIRIQ